MKLPVRDMPVPGESLPGYLIRLAHFNGRFRSGEILKLAGLRDNHSNRQPSLKGLETVCEKLAPLLLVSKEQLAAYFTEQLSEPWLYDEKRVIRDIQLRQPRVCPECFSESDEPIFKQDWQLLPVTHCSKHSAPLVERCPDCQKPLEWHYSIFEGCKHCGLQWSQLHPRTNQGLPQWQLAYISNLNSPEDMKLFLRELATNIVLTARPSDAIHEDISRFPESCRDLHSLISDAFDCGPSDKEYGPKGFVSPRRLKHSDTINHHCGYKGIARVLNLPEGEVGFLASKGLIKIIHETPVLKDTIFDIRTSYQLLENTPKAEHPPEGYVELTPSSVLLDRHATSYGRVLASALDSSAVVYRSSDDLSMVLIEEEFLNRTLRTELLKISGSSVTDMEARKILAISRKELAIMIMNRQILRCTHSIHDLNGDSIIENFKL